MRDRLDELGGETEVVLITFAASELVAEYRDRHELPFPVLVDAERVSYRAYGLDRGSLGRVWGWQTIRRYAAILGSRSGRLERSTEDTRQLGGDFVVAPDGTLSWGFWSTGPADRPSVDDLVEVVRRAT